MSLPALPSLPRPGRPPVPAVAAFAVVLGLLGAGWMWLRDSSLVAVDRVTVTGVSGPDAPRVRAALITAARDMTTLHVRGGELRTAVEPFAVVRGVEAHADFPHALRIVVREHVPVAALAAGPTRLAVAADGTLLRGTPTGDLPLVGAQAPPAGDILSDRRAERALALLGAAPPALRAHVARVYVSPRGLAAPLRDGPVLYFGTTQRLRAKWVAAARVLADRSSAGATYLDLRLPERPAAGGLEQLPQDPPTGGAQVGAQPAQPSTTPPVP
jgi:cell division protein FtsQ